MHSAHRSDNSQGEVGFGVTEITRNGENLRAGLRLDATYDPFILQKVRTGECVQGLHHDMVGSTLERSSNFCQNDVLKNVVVNSPISKILGVVPVPFHGGNWNAEPNMNLFLEFQEFPLFCCCCSVLVPFRRFR